MARDFYVLGRDARLDGLDDEPPPSAWQSGQEAVESWIEGYEDAADPEPPCSSCGLGATSCECD